jgi:sugar phosphate isomerase/epimerase
MRKIGISYKNIKGQSAEETARLLRETGFDCVFTGFKDAAAAENYADVFAGAGLVYESIHAPFEGINAIWTATDEGEAMLGSLLDCLEACKNNKVPVMVVHLSSGNDAPCVNDTGHARWDRLIDRAVGSGVTVAFENQRKLANLAFVMELYKNVPEVGFCWDCGHESCFTPGLEFMPIFGKKLVYTHIHDNFGASKDIQNSRSDDLHYIPFDGGIDFSRFAEHIKKSGFAGTLTLEVGGPNNPKYADKFTPEQYYRRAYDAAVRLVKMCDGE